MKILIFEGEPQVRDLYQIYHERKAFGNAEVVICGSLNEVEKILQNGGFQSLITCWDVTGRSDGIGEKIAQLSIKSGLPSDKIILITRGRNIMEAKQVRKIFEQSIEAKIGDCLIKPVYLEQFRDILRKHQLVE